MAKMVNISDKINFEENPKIQIGKVEIEVNSDAATMLKIMGVLGEKEEPGPKEVVEMYKLLFAEKERKKIEKLKIDFTGLQTIIETAISLVTGEAEQGEQ